jgi:IclR family pca regulon transcriptional regulator
VWCAASVVSHTSRRQVASLRRHLLPELRRAVAEMERALAAPAAAGGADPGAGPAPSAAVRAAKQELGPEFVESLARGLAVLAAFDGAPGPGRSLSALAEATGLPRATVRRSLITLRHLGYVADDGRLFRPEPRVLELGFAHLAGLPLARIARPHLARLVDRVHESASMAVLVGDEIQYAARVPTVRITSVDITVGSRFPAYATAMGRVLLAGLPPRERAARLGARPLPALTRHTVTAPERLLALLEETARDGYALVDEELEDGLRALAVPVRDRDGRVVAAVNVSSHTGRGPASDAVAAMLPPLREAAAAIDDDLRVVGRFTRPRVL